MKGDGIASGTSNLMPICGAASKLNLKKVFPTAVLGALTKNKNPANKVTIKDVETAIKTSSGDVMLLKDAFLDFLGKNEAAIERFCATFGHTILDPAGDDMNIVSHNFTSWQEFMPEILIRVAALYTSDAEGFGMFEAVAKELQDATAAVSELIKADTKTNIRDNDLEDNDDLCEAIEKLVTTMAVAHGLPVFVDHLKAVSKVCSPGTVNHLRLNVHQDRKSVV